MWVQSKVGTKQIGYKAIRLTLTKVGTKQGVHKINWPQNKVETKQGGHKTKWAQSKEGIKQGGYKARLAQSKVKVGTKQGG